MREVPFWVPSIGMKDETLPPSPLLFKMENVGDTPVLSPLKYQCFFVLIHPFSLIEMRREIWKKHLACPLVLVKITKMELNFSQT